MREEKETGHENLGSSQPIQLTKDAKTKTPLKEQNRTRTRKKKAKSGSKTFC